MHPLFFIPCSVLFQSLCNHMPTGWNSWKCPSCSVHCAALLPLFVYTWATSATGYEKECHIWHLNASPYLLYVKEFSLSQGQLHSHCTLHLQTPGITIPGAVLVISNLYKGGKKQSMQVLQAERIRKLGRFHKLMCCSLEKCARVMNLPNSRKATVKIKSGMYSAYYTAHVNSTLTLNRSLNV